MRLFSGAVGFFPVGMLENTSAHREETAPAWPSGATTRGRKAPRSYTRGAVRHRRRT
jgi:hypothetical protein